MTRTMLRSKIHRATVTGADVDYVGSISIDPVLMAAAGILEHEQVHVVDVDNGSRLVTYAIEGGPGEICLNGAAAHLVEPGDKVILITYTSVSDEQMVGYEPNVVHVDSANSPIDEATAKQLAESRRYIAVDASQN